MWQLFFLMICPVASPTCPDIAFSASLVRRLREAPGAGELFESTWTLLPCKLPSWKRKGLLRFWKESWLLLCNNTPSNAPHKASRASPQYLIALSPTLDSLISDPKAPELSLLQPERHKIRPSAEPQRPQSHKSSEQAQHPDRTTPGCRSSWASIA